MVVALAVSPDGKTLASASDLCVALWNVADASQLVTIAEDPWSRQHPLSSQNSERPDLAPRSIAFSPDGKLLAASIRSELTIWDVATGARKSSWQTDAGDTKWLQFSADGKTLSSDSVKFDPTAKAGATIEDWEVPTGKRIGTRAGHAPLRGVIAISSDGNVLAKLDTRFVAGMFMTGSGGGSAELYDISGGTARLLRTLPYASAFECAAFSPDGSLLAVGSGGSGISLRATNTGKCVAALYGHNFGATSLVFSPDSKSLAAITGNIFALWDLAIANGRSLGEGIVDGRLSLAFDRTGKVLFTAASCDSTLIKFWDVASGQQTLARQSPLRRAATLFTPNGEIVAMGKETWDEHQKKYVTFVSTQHKPLALSPDGKVLATVRDHHDARNDKFTLWSIPGGETLASFGQSHNGLECLAFSPDSKAVATSGHDGFIKLWSVSDGKHLDTWAGQNGHGISSLAFSPDGKSLASGSNDARLWDVVTRKNVATLPGGGAVAFSPDGRILASGRQGIKLWDLSALRAKEY